MAALNFPASPVLNQVYSANGKTYVWNGTSWLNATAGYTGSQGYAGSRGYTGSQGVIGYVGSQGNIGYSGSQGNIGYSGSAGFAGSKGFVSATDFWENIPTIQTGTVVILAESNTQLFDPITNKVPINAYEFRKFGSLSFKTARVDYTQSTASRYAVYDQAVSFNVGIYSQGTGTNYTNIYSVSTFSTFFKVQSSITGTNNSTHYVSVRYTYPTVGAVSSTGSATYTIAGTRFTLLTTQLSDLAGFVHIQFPINMSFNTSEANYFVNLWADTGTTFTADTISRWISLTSNAVRYGIFGVNNIVPTFEPMGVTDNAPYKQGAGVFTTNVTGYVSPIAITDIKSSASNPTPYYHLLNTNYSGL